MDQCLSLLLPCHAWLSSFRASRVRWSFPFVSYLKAHFLKVTESLMHRVIAPNKLHKANDIPTCSTPIAVDATIEMRLFPLNEHSKTICPLMTEWARTSFVNHLAMRPNGLPP